MPIIGLTGNFGMGKSTVLQLFHEAGAMTFSADSFVHCILENPSVINKISAILGPEVLAEKSDTPALHKKIVADIIFSDPEKRRAVEDIIHPEVLNKFKTAASGILKKKPSATVIFEVPLLFEAGYSPDFDKTVVVYCSRDRAIERLARKGFSKEEAIKRMRAQMPITEKKKRADYIINNNKGLEETREQVNRIYLDLQ